MTNNYYLMLLVRHRLGARVSSGSKIIDTLSEDITRNLQSSLATFRPTGLIQFNHYGVSIMSGQSTIAKLRVIHGKAVMFIEEQPDVITLRHEGDYAVPIAEAFKDLDYARRNHGRKRQR